MPITEEGRIFTRPIIPEGEFAQAWARQYNEEVANRFNNNPNLIPRDDFFRMNFFKALLVDEMATREYQGRVRAVALSGLSDEVLAMIENKFYTIPTALAFRNTDEIWGKNKPIASELEKHIEQAHGGLPDNAVVSGLRVEPWQEDEEGYQLKVVPIAGKFQVLEDDRLSPKYNGWRFTEIDNNGLPKNLDRKKGKRVWYTSNQRLLRFFLGGDAGLGAIGGDLADSGRLGRVVLDRG